MVDPISVAALSALVGGVLSGVTGEAGAVAFRRLTSLVRRSAPDDTALIERLDAGEIAHSEVVAECLLDAAASDDHISRDLEAWIAARWTTVGSQRTVLVVARTVTMLWWLRDVLGEVLDDVRVQVLFTAPEGSAFADPVPSAIERLGGRLVPWSQAISYPFDLAIAPSHRGELAQLRCPLLLTSHGPGFNKLISLPADRQAPVPDAPASALPATTVMITHHSQRAHWPDQPSVRVVEAGDPHWDMLERSGSHRERYRRALGVESSQHVVLVSSTWGPCGTMGSDPTLLSRLAGALPVDRYAVVAVLHPNVWVAHGAWQIRAWLRRPLEAGVRLVRHDAGWPAALIAADSLIGDHGSVTFYGAALGLPTAIAAFDDEEATPGSPVEALGARAPRWTRDDPDELSRLGGRDPNRYADLVDLSFAHRGHSLERYRETVYELLRLAPPATPTRQLAAEPPRAEYRPVSAVSVRADVTPRTATDPVTVQLVRLPAALAPPPDDDHDRHLVVDDDVLDVRLRHTAAVLVQRTSPVLPAVDAARETLAMLPGARVVVLPLSPASVLVVTSRDVLRVEGPDGLDPAAMGSCIYVLIGRARWTIEPQSVRIVTGTKTTVLTVRRWSPGGP